MDRFIVFPVVIKFFEFCSLKSNMDRFIVKLLLPLWTEVRSLKSNMDRFIEARLFYNCQA